LLAVRLTFGKRHQPCSLRLHNLDSSYAQDEVFDYLVTKAIAPHIQYNIQEDD
jgi:hypothetical protein